VSKWPNGPFGPFVPVRGHTQEGSHRQRNKESSAILHTKENVSPTKQALGCFGDGRRHGV
jgi:hypothetical protein